MPTPPKEAIWDLPPLILHPFNEHTPPSTLLASSRAALMLSGLIAGDGTDPDALARRILAGRYSEVRMLFFLGKDIFRWLEQCLEWVTGTPELAGREWRAQSFAELLSAAPPEEVREKLIRWGVSDYQAIFRRAIGLNTMFANPPAFADLAGEFLRNYHQYADALYHCFMALEQYSHLDAAQFRFALYASGEYARMLESQWENNEE